MKIGSEFQDQLTHISTSLEGQDPLIVKGNFYQICINKLHKIYLCVSVFFIL